MAFRDEVLHIRRQKQRLIDIPGAKILAHGPRLNLTRPELNSDYPDRLLAARTQISSSPSSEPFQYHQNQSDGDRTADARCDLGKRHELHPVRRGQNSNVAGAALTRM